MSDEKPKLHIDLDWKAQAQAEKERLTAEERAREETAGGDGGRGPRDMPDASFKTLVGLLASQAIMGLGAVQDPQSRGMIIDLDGAKFSIELLGVLEEKTKGNLAEDERAELTQVLVELRARFVQITKLIAHQAAGAAARSPAAAAD